MALLKNEVIAWIFSKSSARTSVSRESLRRSNWWLPSQFPWRPRGASVRSHVVRAAGTAPSDRANQRRQRRASAMSSRSCMRGSSIQ
jgi:hypothetical protein